MKSFAMIALIGLAGCGGVAGPLPLVSAAGPDPLPLAAPTQAGSETTQPAAAENGTPQPVTTAETATVTTQPTTQLSIQAALEPATAPQSQQANTTLATPVLQPAALPAANAPAPDASFASLLNGVRGAAGSGDVMFDARLDRAAQGHADELVATGRFSHTGADGSTVGTRTRAEGYRASAVAENIARGQQTEQQALTAWQNSSGHRANNLNPRYEDFGFGVAGTGSRLTWVLVLGAE